MAQHNCDQLLLHFHLNDRFKVEIQQKLVEEGNQYGMKNSRMKFDHNFHTLDVEFCRWPTLDQIQMDHNCKQFRSFYLVFTVICLNLTLGIVSSHIDRADIWMENIQYLEK